MSEDVQFYESLYMSEDVQFYESLYKLDTDVVLRCNVIANSVETVN